MSIPFYNRPENAKFNHGRRQVHFIEIVEFLKYIIARDNLEISHYLKQMGEDPFFLVAATGLGKTVAVPVHVLLRQMQRISDSPERDVRIWVVEPRIPIATDQAAFMNTLWQEYRAKQKRPATEPLFGCVTSVTGNQGREALIKFVTTGVFAQLAKNDDLSPLRDRVIIDEAHVTIEQNPDVELGITLARKAGVTVDYMSATVDTRGLKESLGISTIIHADKTRQIIWMRNLGLPLADCLTDLVANTLISPNPNSSYYPNPRDFPKAQAVLNAVLQPGRSHGMMVVVNSFAGEQSDINQLREQLRRAFPDLPVLVIASAVLRNPAAERAFKSKLKAIEAAQQNYVILATSVVEMGITIPTLDYVTTMDSGYTQETIGDATFPVVGPLGVNALLQRIGRVGRKRPGIAYISNDAGAPYAELDNDELNSKPLPREPIRFPLETASLLPLAHYLWGQGYREFQLALRWFNFPSRLNEKPERVEELYAQLRYLDSLGLVSPDGLMHLGEKIEPWIGRADLAYAAQLQRCLAEGADEPELIFWIVATALSNFAIAPLHGKYGYFVDFTKRRSVIGKSANAFPFRDAPHEDMQLFLLINVLSLYFPNELWGGTSLGYGVEQAMEYMGIDPDVLRKMIRAIQELNKLFARINRRTPIDFAALDWEEINTLSSRRIADVLSKMPHEIPITFSSDREGTYTWQATTGASGVIKQDDTPIQLGLPGARYHGKPVPAQFEGGSILWQLMHIGIR